MSCGISCLKALGHNLRHLLIALDQLCNVALLMCLCPKERHYADETLSSHCWRWHAAGARSWPKNLVDGLFFWDRAKGKGHCQLSFDSEREGRQLPPECRNGK